MKIEYAPERGRGLFALVKLKNNKIGVFQT